MNQTLKETLIKLAIETGGDWVTLLPFALFWVHNTTYKLNLTPFEILYGRPPPVYYNLDGKALMLFSLPLLLLSRSTGLDPGFTAITCSKPHWKNRKKREQNGR